MKLPTPRTPQSILGYEHPDNQNPLINILRTHTQNDQEASISAKSHFNIFLASNYYYLGVLITTLYRVYIIPFLIYSTNFYTFIWDNYENIPLLLLKILINQEKMLIFIAIIYFMVSVIVASDLRYKSQYRSALFQHIITALAMFNQLFYTTIYWIHWFLKTFDYYNDIKRFDEKIFTADWLRNGKDILLSSRIVIYLVIDCMITKRFNQYFQVRFYLIYFIIQIIFAMFYSF